MCIKVLHYIDNKNHVQHPFYHQHAKLIYLLQIFPAKKKVDFLKARDGCEWVWVMGEHKDDKSIEQLIEEETQVAAKRQAEAEALALR